MKRSEVSQRVARAAAIRADAGLGSAATDAYRLVNGAGDALEGLFVDRLGEVAFVRYRDPSWKAPATVEALVDALRDIGLRGARFVPDLPAKHRIANTAAPDADLRDGLAALDFDPPEEPVLARESSRVFELSLDRGFSHGLFFDMRPTRDALRQRWAGRRVLNLFAYTCGFGVALEPAAEVVNVDVSASYLAWGARNYAHNGLATAAHSFVKKDAFEYLRVAAKVGNTFDAIVLDPPPFSRGKRGRARRFAVRDDLPELISAALVALTDDGELLVATNYEGLDSAAFRSLVTTSAHGRGRSVSDGWAPGPDYPLAPGAVPQMKAAFVGP